LLLEIISVVYRSPIHNNQRFLRSLKMRFWWTLILLLYFTSSSAQLPGQAAERSQKLLDLLQSAAWPAANALLSPDLGKKIDTAQLEVIWQGLQVAQGNLQKVGELVMRERNGQLYYYRQLDFVKSSVRLELQFNARWEITSLRLQPLSDEQLYLPPAYDHPEKYQEYSMRVRHDSIVLPAILTLPKDCKACAVVLLLHDMGPQDKDHSIGPTKMFRDLAVGLAAEGIASLRYDKRTFRYGPELMADLRVLNFENEVIEDALAAIQLLRTVSEIDTQRISLIGLGFGGMLAGHLASRSPLPIRHVLAVGSSPRPLPDQLLDQYIQLLSAEMGFAAMQAAVQQLERQTQLAKSIKLSAHLPADSLPLQLPAPYWQRLQKFDPLAGYWQTDAELWFVRGGNDYQSQAGDQEQWEMRLLGRSKVRFSTLPQLNHLLMPATDSISPTKAYQKQNNVDAAALKAISAWLE
jgi:dienelactone hydrolase